MQEDELGKVKEGYLVDVILVDGDPLRILLYSKSTTS